MAKGLTRRDFLNGTALVAASALCPLDQFAAATGSAAYPPSLQGLRGSTDAAYEVMHALAREGRKFPVDRVEPSETYDLVVVGAGLAGLTAAWLYRAERPRAKILILDNHDDFGGHARRTEHVVGGRLLLGYGGSESMVAPKVKFAGEPGRVLKGLGIRPERFESEDVFHRKLYPGLGLSKAVFFDRETFGRDALVKGDPLVLGFDEFAPNNPGARPIAKFLADCPLTPAGRDGLVELFAGRRDYMAGVPKKARIENLGKMTYRAFLTDVCRLPADAANFFQNRSSDNWGFGIDAISATDAMGDGFPGAKALKLGKEVSGHSEDKAAYVHHFPDGNASIARALVRSLVKGVAPGTGMEDIVTAPFDYSRLDRAGEPVRIRLEATVVDVRNVSGGKSVDVGYVKDAKPQKVRAGAVVVSTYAVSMAHICPELSKPAREAMLENVKAPLVYTKVAIRNWMSFARLGVHRISAPTGFHCVVKLDYPVSLGTYRFPRRPEEPIGLHLVHVPLEPLQGHDMRTQARLGRQRLLETSFQLLETAIRQDLDRMLGPGGFDAGRDIAGITVNRWSHGYSYTPNALYDDLEAMEKAGAAMKARLGNIVFASSDTAWDAYAHSAMSEAARAVGELVGKPEKQKARSAG